GVLADMQGPKLRVGTFAAGPVMLNVGSSFRLDLIDKPGDVTRAYLPHPEIFAALKPGANLLLDDGKLRLQVKKSGRDFAETEVVVGGALSERKGVNVPDVVLPLSALTQKDRRDLEFALELGVEWLALSFVQRPEDPVEAVQMMERIIGEVESDPYHRQLLESLQTPAQPTSADAICTAMDVIAGLLRVAVIVTYTTSGSTSLRAARERPVPPILSMTPSLATARKLALVCGVHSVKT